MGPNMKLGPALLLSLLPLATLVGCAAETTNDPQVADSAEDLTGRSNNGYFVVTHRDLRRCVSPICGGYFVKRVNQAKTVCVDGSLQDECYVSDITFGGVGLSAREESELRDAVVSGKALVKARLYKHTFNGSTLATLKATEGWLGATGSAATGTIYRGADNGIRCIKAPCPSITAYGLNGADSHNVIDVRLDSTATPADADVLASAETALSTKDGILFAGGIALPKCVVGSACGPIAIATEFYVRVTHTEGKSCGGRGMGTCGGSQYCSWTTANICGAADAAGSCAYAPDLCYQLVLPVCGCDGKTYNNDCMAHAARTSVSSTSACAHP